MQIPGGEARSSSSYLWPATKQSNCCCCCCPASAADYEEEGAAVWVTVKANAAYLYNGAGGVYDPRLERKAITRRGDGRKDGRTDSRKKMTRLLLLRS